MRAKSGFTLVEILIVVVILGILAAIVIPQFTEASTEAKTSRVASDLQMLRSQIELFKVQHGDLYPGQSSTVSGTPTAAQCAAALLGKSDSNGDANDAGPLGPYMQKIPTNPFANSNQDTITPVDSGTNPKNETYGWWLNITSGSIQPNSDIQGEDQF